MTEVTLKDLLPHITYNPDTGEFTRLKNNKRADTDMKTGYKRVRVKIGDVKHEFLAHRLAWFITHKTWPTHQIDHINGNRGDNRIVNLRDVTQAENTKNMRLRKSNQSGFYGVNRHQTGWKVVISGEYVGSTTCIARAIKMRKEAEIKMGYHKNHGRSL